MNPYQLEKKDSLYWGQTQENGGVKNIALLMDHKNLRTIYLFPVFK